MIDFLLGVPGKLKTISDYLTTNLAAVRTARIDNLDAPVSTRAVAVTALSNATWSDTRAAKLDSVILTSVINSIQTNTVGAVIWSSGTGEDLFFKDVLISSVDLAKCICLVTGTLRASGGTFPVQPMARLTSPTNLRLSTHISPDFNSGVYPYVRWTVVAFK